ncbi:hypothetical protein BAY61_30860 [Prauserella marina]|uniref:Uncharacterized protein n=1 Tax=Prauserella marina TaxID=530584 RepID=A0A222VXY3_9PSEU|nr:hypothetical protein [Prauserella marina]ASR38672.1 hypothetical protein BAY61_30860 [Prauserella marina]PWV82007.1 hypothetical protein DES30_102241 [Prauserella marina]SDD17286.1 hypothetical protein SAMN05421630_106241 [Prauserella marina]
MENTASEYLSFVRGYLAATDGTTADLDYAALSGGDMDSDAYAEGYAAGLEPDRPAVTYLELSVRDDGRFTGTLDLSHFAEEPEPPAQPVQPEPPEPADWPRDEHDGPRGELPGELTSLSGTLDLG